MNRFALHRHLPGYGLWALATWVSMPCVVLLASSFWFLDVGDGGL